jgi:hypothetical protein
MIVLTPKDRITRSPVFGAWLTSNGLQGRKIYRLEIAPDLSATVFEFDTRDGKVYAGTDRTPAKRDPYTVTLNSLPPSRVEQATQAPGELR